MRQATQELSDYVKSRLTAGGYPQLVLDLNLPYGDMPTLRRIVLRELQKEGVSWEKENDIRRGINWPELPKEIDTYNPQTHKITPIKKKTTRKPAKIYWRPCLNIALKEHFTATEINEHLAYLVALKADSSKMERTLSSIETVRKEIE